MKSGTPAQALLPFVTSFGATDVRRIFWTIAPLLVAGYLCALWSDWFANADRASLRRSLFSDRIDLGKPGAIVWLVPKDDWSFKDGDAYLELALDTMLLREIPDDRRQFELKVKIRAEGRKLGGGWEDRLIRDWYFNTDEPFSEKAALQVAGGLGYVDYLLAGVRILPDEELRITMDVKVPDGRLMRGKPRLKLVRKGHEDIPTPLVLAVYREGGFVGSLALLAALAFFAWRRAAGCSGAPEAAENHLESASDGRRERRNDK